MLFAGFLYVYLVGLVIVRDRGADVIDARVVTGGPDEQRLRRLPGGLFVGIPDVEGSVAVRCRDGSTDEAGYVTGFWHTRIVVERGPPGRACQAREG